MENLMSYYKDYPIVAGKLTTPSNLIAKCPYCGNIEHFHYNKSCTNPTKRQSHCKAGSYDYYYIYIKNKEEVKKDGRDKSNV